MVSNYIKISTVVDEETRTTGKSFKLHQNFYCCRSYPFHNLLLVSNYIKISTVVDSSYFKPITAVSNYIKISTVVDGQRIRRQCNCFKLHQNFYCCRSFSKQAQNNVSNYIKISTVVDSE